MKSLQQLAAHKIREDVTPFMDCLHELPVPVLNQLLSALTPCQLLQLESQLSGAVDTEPAWQVLCECYHYLNKQLEPWDMMQESCVSGRFRCLFLKNYLSSYLLPFLIAWPQDKEAENLRPTEKVFCTQGNHVYKNDSVPSRQQFPPLTWEFYLHHLVAAAAHAQEVSVMGITLQCIMSYPQLICAFRQNLRVLRVRNISDNNITALFQILIHLLLLGKLEALYLKDVCLSPQNWDFLFLLASGILQCPSCGLMLEQHPFVLNSRLHPDVANILHDYLHSRHSKVHACSPVSDQSRKMHRKCAFDRNSTAKGVCSSFMTAVTDRVDVSSRETQTRINNNLNFKQSDISPSEDCTNCANSHRLLNNKETYLHIANTSSHFGSNSAMAKNQKSNTSIISTDWESYDKERSQDKETFNYISDEESEDEQPAQSEEIDLFDEAVTSVRFDTDEILINNIHQNGTHGKKKSTLREYIPFHHPSPQHQQGIHSLSLLPRGNSTCQHTMSYLAYWLPDWTCLQQLVLQIDYDIDWESAKLTLLEKIRTGELKRIVLMFVRTCVTSQQFLWDILQVTASYYRHRLLFMSSISDMPIPIENLAISSESQLSKTQLNFPDEEVFGLRALQLWETNLNDIDVFHSITQYIAHDQALTSISLKRCHISAQGLDLLIDALETRETSTLTQLSLDGSELGSSHAWHRLPLLLIKNEFLTTLSLSDCCLTPDHLANPKFIKSLKGHPSLRSLDLSHNHFDETLIHFLLEVVFPGSHLKSLNIGNTRLSLQVIHTLVDSLLQCPDENLPLLDSLTVPGLHWAWNTSTAQHELMSKVQRIAVHVFSEGEDYVSEYMAQM